MRNYSLSNYDPFFDLFFPVQGEAKNHHMMRTDIIEKKDAYELKVNIPGVKKEDVKVSLHDGYLTINVSYKEEINEDDKYLYQERKFGEYSRSYSVGEFVKQEDISASIDNGVLTVTIQKRKEETKNPQYIEIK